MHIFGDDYDEEDEDKEDGRSKGKSEFDEILLDYSKQQATLETREKPFKLAEVASLKQKINRMYNGEHINNTGNRSVLHVALRAPRDVVIQSDGNNVVPHVWNVRDKIQEFSERVRSGSLVNQEQMGSTIFINLYTRYGGTYLHKKKVMKTPNQPISMAGLK